MVENLPPHAIALELKEPVLEEIDAAADFSFAVTVASSCGCDHSGAPFKILEGDHVRVVGEVPNLTGEHHDTAEIRMTAPEQIGEFEWTLVVPAHEINGLVHEEASLSFSFRTRHHGTGVAAWDNPSPVVIGETFRLKVGAKCTASCALTGHQVEIQDETGTSVASAVLGETPWQGTTALYWAVVEVAAPAEPGLFRWSLNFPAAEPRVPHSSASCAFSFVTVLPPEHLVSVKVVERGTDLPIHDAHVRVGAYRGSTDETGLARFAVHTGEHRVFVWKPGYDAPERTIDVKKDDHVRIEAAVLPEDDPDAYWQG